MSEKPSRMLKDIRMLTVECIKGRRIIECYPEDYCEKKQDVVSVAVLIIHNHNVPRAVIICQVLESKR